MPESKTIIEYLCRNFQYPWVSDVVSNGLSKWLSEFRTKKRHNIIKYLVTIVDIIMSEDVYTAKVIFLLLPVKKGNFLLLQSIF